ncbi:MAG: beta-N-acetylhexosaminidase [Marinagarivorans sp.]|nr:beta-N-acetylhexosaminidase [Marinagarivorans sp.]
MAKNDSLGSVMLDVAGQALTDIEREVLAHPQVGGLILFSRNYESPQQITDLIAEIRSVRSNIIIAVDHEGGRVQRFKQGFTRIPSMFDLAHKAPHLLTATANHMALELMAVGIDLTFAPVLDRFNPNSKVIGDRAFSESPKEIAVFAEAFIKGLKQAGMAAVGKHFPGHGGVDGDTHLETTIDEREFAEIEQSDLIPFKQLMPLLQGIMPAHVIFPAVCDSPVGFSRRWLQEILRKQLQFNGVIFSDDLSMEAAKLAGGPLERGVVALTSGCDMVLFCNHPDEAITLIEGLESQNNKSADSDLQLLSSRVRRSQAGFNYAALQQQASWKNIYRQLNDLNESLY